MGKVLIALCTVFLLAFPARGEQAVTWESLAVWNDLPPLYDPAPWPSDLAGKRVILRWNGKHNGDLLLDYLHSLLSRAFPDTEFIKAYETDPALSGISKDLPESEATARALLELRPDLVIAATGDCRACSAWLAIDQIQLERAGVPTLTILTQPFLKTFHNVRQNLRIGPLHCVAVPHPWRTPLREGGRQHENLSGRDGASGGSRSIVRRTGETGSGRPSVTGTARARMDCGLSHRCPGKAAMPPPSQRRPIPKRRSPHCRKKAVRTVQDKEKYLSSALYRADGLFIPTPYGIDAVPPYKNGPRHCAERPFSTLHRQPGFRRAFPYPAPCFTQAGRQGRGPADSRYGVTGWPFEGRPPQKPSAEG